MRHPGIAPTVDEVLARAATGEPVGVDDAEILLAARGDELDALLHAASALRDEGLARAGRPGIITYSRKVFIPLTTLCRDRCHYCVFVDTPGQLLLRKAPLFMSREQVVSLARQGAELGCKEALFTLGDRPEDRWPEARAWLDEHGYTSTLDYVADMARAVVDETGMLPHLNPGVMSAEELATLRPLAPSMGMMLESTSRRIFEERGQVHYGSPDKDPAVRLQVIDDAGAARIPFTTGILVSIGETLRDRAESLVAIREANDRHRVDGLGHVQETIVQNFRAKPRTAAAGLHDAELAEYLAAVATARLVMGADARIQVPPNLSDPTEFALLVRAGIDDWGGVSPLTADHVNPERPWPHLDDLARLTAEFGFELRERLTAHPEYLRASGTWLDPAIVAPTMALSDAATLLAAEDAVVGPSTRSARSGTGASARSGTGTARLVDTALERARDDAAGLADAELELLLTATGEQLEALVELADLARRHTVGDAISLVVNRNLTSSGLRLRRDPDSPTGVFTLDDAAAIAADAWALGATELCIQGVLPAHEPATGYLDLARAVKAAAPGLHLHAFRPQDVDDLATRGGLGLAGALDALREAGVDTMPGTGVKVLDESIRRQVAPNDLPIERWIEIVEAAHAAGFSTSSVLFSGHVESAADRVAHLRTLLRIQERTGGFTEFVPITAPALAPGTPTGVPLVAGRTTIDEARAQVAVSRLMLSGRIPHVQIPWPRLGLDEAAVLLRSGGDDLGGALLDGRVLPEAGVEHGRELPVAEAQRLAHRLLRPFRQRTTTYGEPSAERKAVSGARRMVPGSTADTPGRTDDGSHTIRNGSATESAA